MRNKCPSRTCEKIFNCCLITGRDIPPVSILAYISFKKETKKNCTNSRVKHMPITPLVVNLMKQSAFVCFVIALNLNQLKTATRGISNVSPLGRLYRTILKTEIQSEIAQIEEQSSFRSGRSCLLNTLALL